jgi:pyrimidine-nucleoside phosphorylase
VAGVVDGRVTRPQAAALLAFVCCRGMDTAETLALTRAMTASGPTLRWPGIEGPFVDKHSTGGVGDKTSLVLAPLWAELGLRVPMISGRGLGHTGGTLDKLEAVPGYRVQLPVDALRRQLAGVGCFIAGQTAGLCPADAILYGLRDETSTVPSIPLIVASILSKKLAEGLDRLVLDVKYGSGAFMRDRAQAEALAAALVEVGEGAGVSTRAALSPMHAPLGEAVGNAVEVEEALRCLRGEGPADLRALVLELAEHPGAAAALDAGRALPRFEAMLRAQGGDPAAPLLGLDAVKTLVMEASDDGRVTRVDALQVGLAAFELGAGRRRADEAVHPGVGLRVKVKPGDEVVRGQPLVEVLHADRGLDEALRLLSAALRLEPAGG